MIGAASSSRSDQPAPWPSLSLTNERHHAAWRAFGLQQFLSTLLLTTLLNHAPPSQAKSLPTSALQNAHAEHALREGNFVGAAHAFDTLYRASPSGELALRAALAHLKAGSLERARDYYLHCVTAHDLDPKERQSASLALAQLEKTLEERGTRTPPRAFSPHRRSLTAPRSPQSSEKIQPTKTPPPKSSQSIAYSTRPLSLPRGTWGLASGIGLGHNRHSSALALGLSALTSFGIIDQLEVGLSLMQLQLYERVVYDRPALYLLAQLFQGHDYAVGAKVEVVAGVQTQTPWTLNTSLSQVYRPYTFIRMDTSLLFEFLVGESVVNVLLPIKGTIQFSEQVYGALDSAFVFLLDSDNIILPLGLSVGYTFSEDERPLCDLSARFGWPLLYNLTYDDTDLETFTGELVVRCFIAH